MSNLFMIQRACYGKSCAVSQHYESEQHVSSIFLPIAYYFTTENESRILVSSFLRSRGSID